MASFAGTSQNYYTYARSVFEHPSKWYDSYQENGTKYLKSRKKLDEALQLKLNACAGEIFISGIPGETRAEQIANIASQLGEVYILRFKVNFSGDSRGFAYLQYMDPSIMQLSLARLPPLFRQNSLPMIRVRESRNSSKLLLKKTYGMLPEKVFETLKSLITFDQLVGHEIYPGYFEYQIIFKCNEEAVHARRDLLRLITKFGRNAVIVWDTPNFNNNYQNNTDETNGMGYTPQHHRNRRGVHIKNSMKMIPEMQNFVENQSLLSPMMAASSYTMTEYTSMRSERQSNYVEGQGIMRHMSNANGIKRKFVNQHF